MEDAGCGQPGWWMATRTKTWSTMVMVKIEDFQQYGKEHFDAAVASAGTFSKGLQAIAAAVSDYSKKSFEDGSAFVEKLASVKSLDKAIEVQTDYAKTAYESLVAE